MDLENPVIIMSENETRAVLMLFEQQRQGYIAKLAEARAEVERKDKLIKRMREALRNADVLIAEYAADYEHRDNVDEMRYEIKATLEAAERGGE